MEGFEDIFLRLGIALEEVEGVGMTWGPEGEVMRDRPACLRMALVVKEDMLREE